MMIQTCYSKRTCKNFMIPTFTLSRKCSAFAAAAAVFCLASPGYADTVSFGSGANQFNMDFVTIGNPGNAADTTGDPNPAGAVGYTYNIGKFEVSRNMINLYNATSGVVAITLDSMSGITGGTGANKPATGISPNEASRFVNWLNTSTGGVVAYNYADSTINTDLTPWTSADTLDYDASNPYRSKRAKYFLPSYNEWYKAAYYDPNKATGSDQYWNYATGSDTAPAAVVGGTGTGGNGNNEAVYLQTYSQGPADVTNAGGFSSYGVMGLNGNVYEWDESSFDVTSGNYNISGSSFRGIRGGRWNTGSSSFLSSSTRLTAVLTRSSTAMVFVSQDLMQLQHPLFQVPFPCLVSPPAMAGAVA